MHCVYYDLCGLIPEVVGLSRVRGVGAVAMQLCNFATAVELALINSESIYFGQLSFIDRNFPTSVGEFFWRESSSELESESCD